MRVRIRLRRGSKRRRVETVDRQAMLIMSSLLTPVAVMAWSLAAWRLAADLRWTGDFAIRTGVFSHWQVWTALGVLVQFGAFLLHRYAVRNSSTDPAEFR